VRFAPVRWLRGDEVVAPQRLVHRRDRRGIDSRAAKLGPDAPRTEARVPAPKLADLRLEQGIDPPG